MVFNLSYLQEVPDLSVKGIKCKLCGVWYKNESWYLLETMYAFIICVGSLM